MEIGVPIFFVLSGFLLFRPWVKSAATGGPEPSVRRYAWHRVRRIMPAYIVTVLLAFLIYHFRTAGPNFGHTWIGLFRNLTLTQIYTFNYMRGYLHQGLTQMWSLAVEAAFYVVLPLLAYLLLVVLCRRQWRPRLVLLGLCALALISPAWLIVVHLTTSVPNGMRLWLPTYLIWFLAGIEPDGAAGDGGALLRLCRVCRSPSSAISSLRRRSRVIRRHRRSACRKRLQSGVLRGDRRAGRGAAGARRPGLVRPVPCEPADGVARGDLLRDLLDPLDNHGNRDGLRDAGSRLYRFDARAVRGDVGIDHPVGLAAAPFHAGAQLRVRDAVRRRVDLRPARRVPRPGPRTPRASPFRRLRP